VKRGHTVRAWRRVPGVAAAVGAAVAVAVVVSVAPPASHPVASHPVRGPGSKLAAWTATRQADGTVHVSFFRQLRDPAALQRSLRANGVPASVTYRPAKPGMPQRPEPGRADPRAPRRPTAQPADSGPGSGNGTWLAANGRGDARAIRPSELPSGDGVQSAVMRGHSFGAVGVVAVSVCCARR
jgi:hypothetical protein